MEEDETSWALSTHQVTNSCKTSDRYMKKERHLKELDADGKNIRGTINIGWAWTGGL
jgi:hypothetical protein